MYVVFTVTVIGFLASIAPLLIHFPSRVSSFEAQLKQGRFNALIIYAMLCRATLRGVESAARTSAPVIQIQGWNGPDLK